jgi:hypothetical protein
MGGYNRKDGQFANVDLVVPILAGSVVTASGNSGVIEVGDKSSLRLSLAVTAATGTNPTLDVAVMTCETPDGTFRQVYALAVGGATTFTQATAATTQRLSFAALDRFVRVDWTIGGTNSPTFTCGISGELA